MLYLCSQNSNDMNIETMISKAAQEAVKALYGQEVPEKMVQLQKTRSEFEGNLTLVVFPFVKMARKSPEQTAQEIGDYLQEHCGAVEKFNVVKGFLNICIGNGAWIELLRAIDSDEHFGMKDANEQSPPTRHDRILLTQHQQTLALRACAQQSSRLVISQDHGSQWQQGGQN